MECPPSLAKISRPALHEIAPRLRLFRQLDRALERPVLWVVGPPGAGKTTLVASYLERRRLRGAWCRLDEGDADPATFFHYLELAASRTGRRVSHALPQFDRERGQAPVAFAKRFFRALYGGLPRPFVLVLDGFQAIAADSEVHRVIREGLAEIPEGGHVVLISRSDPSPVLARSIANHSAALFGWEDLRLTAQESTAIARLQGRRLDKTSLLALHERAAGWAQGLLLLLARTDVAGASAVLAEPLEPTLSDYFAEEVFERIEPRTRDLLLQTAWMPAVSADLAWRLTGITAAGRLLEELRRRHCFTERRGEAPAEYRYHPLFRAFLLERAAAVFAPARLRRIRRTAARLLEASGRVEEAAELLRDAADWVSLERLLREHAPLLLSQGREQLVEGWLRDMPSHLLGQAPWLLFWLGASTLPQDPAGARERLVRALSLFRKAGDVRGLSFAWASVVETIVHEWNDFRALDRWIALFRRELAGKPLRSPDAAGRAAFATFAALMYRQPAAADLPAWEERARALVLRSPDAPLRMAIGPHLLLYHAWWTGQLGAARMILDALRPTVRTPAGPPLARIACRFAEAAYHAATGSSRHCLKMVRDGLEEGRTEGVHLWHFMLCGAGVFGSLAGGDLPGAERCLEQMGAALELEHAAKLCLHHQASGLLALWRGDSGAALEHGRAALAQADRAGMPFAQAQCHLTMALALAERGDRAEIAGHLARAHGIGRSMKSASIEHLCLLAEARLSFARGEKAAALEPLRRGLEIGRAQGWFMQVWLPPTAMADLCAAALEHGIEVEYVRAIIRKRHLIPGSPPTEIEGWPWPVKVHTLGRFEVVTNGKPWRPAARARRRPLQLLKALIASGATDVSEQKLMEGLWPQAEGDAARQDFDTTLYRLRKLLGVAGALVLREGRLSVDPRLCWVDATALERTFARLEAALLAAPDEAAIAQLVEHVLELYRGPFLGDDEDLPAGRAFRERLRHRVGRLLGKAGQLLEEQGDRERVMDWYERALEADDLLEPIRRRLAVLRSPERF